MRRGRVHDVNVVDTVLPHSNLRSIGLKRLTAAPAAATGSSTVRYVIECVFVRCPVWFNMN
jgi:hypothetical protein